MRVAMISHRVKHERPRITDLSKSKKKDKTRKRIENRPSAQSCSNGKRDAAQPRLFRFQAA